MRRSFVGWVVGLATLGVLAFLGFGTMYSQHFYDWSEEEAKQSGLFLAYELLDSETADRREARLDSLRQHFGVPLAIVDRSAVERRVDRPVAPNETIPLRVSHREQWLMVMFSDGREALVAGPVDPVFPNGRSPIGVFVALAGVPLFLGVLALVIDRSQRQVERASDAIAAGNLSARAEHVYGPSREMVARFNAMAERVETLVSNRDELVQAVSHELGSPLARLRFQLELLSTAEGDEREARFQTMNDELDGLDELVAELLSYMQSDEVVLEPKQFAPAETLTHLAELAQLTCDSPIEVDLDLDPAIEVHADVRLFQRAVENLLRNALQHAAHEVRLELTVEGSEVRVRVQDDGAGIPEALRARILQPFIRAEADRGRTKGGAGLGLAIVNRIMKRHGGRVEMGDSALGGASVSTWWPPARP